MKYIIAYDLGTGGAKASLYDENGSSYKDCFISYPTYYPESGFHEQRPADWWNAIVDSTRLLLEGQKIDKKQISCLAVSGHSLGALPMSAEGELLAGSVPIWSDSRAKKQAERFFKTIDQNQWYLTTGNGFPAPLYSVFKIMWYMDNMPELYKNTHQFIGTKDYINYRFTGKLCTDFSYASGSGVYDLKKWDYQQDYIKTSGVDSAKFPQVFPSSEIIGNLTGEAAEALGLHTDVQVACGGVDNACMALGAGSIHEGMAYTSLGSSSWIAVSSEQPIVDIHKKPYVFTHCIPNMFVSSTAIFAAGNSFRWLRDTVCRDLLGAVEPYDEMTKLAAGSSIGANKLFFNPSLAGGSSIDKSPNIKGGFLGLQLGHSQSDLIRATLEGITLNLRIALDVMQEYVTLSKDMLIVGGGGKSEFWRKLFADIYNKNIIQTNVGQDAGSLGAAAVAAVGVGLWSDYSKISQLHIEKSRIAPNIENNAKYEQILKLTKTLNDIEAGIGDLIERTSW